MGRVGELHHPRHELGAVAVVLGTVVLVEDEPVDAAKTGVVDAPPGLDDVRDGVGSQGALDDVNPQLAGLRYQDADGNNDRIGREVVVERLDELPREPVAAQLANLDGGLGVDGEAQLVFGSVGASVDEVNLIEDRVGLGDLFFGLDLRTRCG